MVRKRRYSKEYYRLYGKEWRAIALASKRKCNYTCQICGTVHDPYYLDVHHIIPISYFLEAGYSEKGKLHTVYGVKTTKMWHIKSNLLVVCTYCHAEIHPHLLVTNKNGRYNHHKETRAK